MLISHKKRFIFIHIYKTAGTSVMHALLPYARLIDRMAYEYMFTRRIFWKINDVMGWRDSGMRQFTGFHKHATAYEVQRKLGRKTFDSYFKFAFVRNPFDSLVSLYFYILQHYKHRDHETVVNMKFPEFIKWYLTTEPKLHLDFLMTPTRDRLLVNYVGRFETLSQDTAAIREKLGLEAVEEMKHKNPSVKRKKENFRHYYDDECIALVSDYFKADLDGLGYDFDGIQNKMPIIERN